MLIVTIVSIADLSESRLCLRTDRDAYRASAKQCLCPWHSDCSFVTSLIFVVYRHTLSPYFWFVEKVFVCDLQSRVTPLCLFFPEGMQLFQIFVYNSHDQTSASTTSVAINIGKIPWISLPTNNTIHPICPALAQSVRHPTPTQ